jgi:PadR family transcriptional regulator PadR
MNRHLLTDLELMIVLAVLRTGEEAYGAEIAREIERTGGRRVLLGAIYATLDRLERNGLVVSTRRRRAADAPSASSASRRKACARPDRPGRRSSRSGTACRS